MPSPGRPAGAAAPPPRGAPVQPTLEDIGTPLSEVTFVVVDLETTGGTPGGSAITEIGAVKVRGGEVLGEFQTLVDPGVPVPAFIAALTGITTSMVAGAPRIAQVLPGFLEFASGAVLVAHNAPFDVGFLKAAARELGYPWPGPQVLDTVALARRAVTRDEVPNHKLGTLAAFFRATVTPDHRALSDARATVDVLHALLARLGPLGITHLEDLATATDPVPAARRRKRHLADGLPDAPGVYQFRDARGEVLYVGTATSIRTRVRSYFTAAEHRRRMTEMVGLAEEVVPIVCGTVLEARVRELRLIAEHSPRYNRRSRFPERMPWVRLTLEPYPRLSIVREVRRDGPGAPDGTSGATGAPGASAAGTGVAAHIGPFAGRVAAQQAIDALQATFALRQCTGRLPRAAAPGASPCALAGMGRCGAPCTGAQDEAGYAAVVEQVRRAMVEDPAPVVGWHADRIAALVAAERYEEAAGHRDRLTAFLRAAARSQRSRRAAEHAEVVAARPHDGGWEIVVVRHGRLGATATTPRGQDPRSTIEALVATAEHVPVPVAPATSAHPEESEIVLAWLDEPGVRLVAVEEGWGCPVRGAEAYRPAGATAAAVAGHVRGGGTGDGAGDPAGGPALDDGGDAGRGAGHGAPVGAA
ncbi:DEDD exonuclease domain-containing protein [Actinotalea sp.]|uniref:DEDD exonuclease domain-containing protein n=1 Tax=Actinotalea sp. TaxID=1872145 RepID=UPI002C6F8A22|nr:DEDD exonuclease domain-containing protein [Actinotalea sp.]HQY34331.1 DEDD exonuclease domain-containing protein [Actinotalea sp.]HRA51261.1 DEDD exonuclease domain-containing protein [Actinotalea sp.]